MFDFRQKIRYANSNQAKDKMPQLVISETSKIHCRLSMNFGFVFFKVSVLDKLTRFVSRILVNFFHSLLERQLAFFYGYELAIFP